MCAFNSLLLLENVSFRALLELVPDVRELVVVFHRYFTNYVDTLEIA